MLLFQQMIQIWNNKYDKYEMVISSEAKKEISNMLLEERRVYEGNVYSLEDFIKET